MAKEQKKIIRRRVFRLYLSSIVSISLLLFLIGFFAIMALGARNLSKFFKENIRLVTILTENTTENQADSLSLNIQKMKFVKGAEVISKEQGTAEMKEFLGEDFLDIFESNPIPVTINVFVESEYFLSDSLKILRENILESDMVEDVVYQEDVVLNVNKNLKIVSIVFTILLALLLFVSIVLINNTVRLNLFSRRFSIRTMQLVGSTKSFIQKPFLYQAIIQGIISALIAIVALIVVGFMMRHQLSMLFSGGDRMEFIVIGGALIIFGVLLCLVSTWLVVRKLLNMSVNKLYY